MLALPPGKSRRVYLGARVFDGETLCEDVAVLVEGTTIAALLPAAALPRDIPVAIFPGCTLLPGLIDSHAHFMRWEGPSYLAYGVTTVRDVANPLRWILARRAEAPAQPWPRLFVTGPAIDGPEPHWPEISVGARDVEDGCRWVQRLAKAGVDGIKLYVRLPEEWIAPITRAAHDAGLPVMMHCSHSVLAAARAGIDECFHLDGLLGDIWPDCPATGWMAGWGHPDITTTWSRQQQVADELARLGVIVTPTMTVWDYFRRSYLQDQPTPDDAAYIPSRVTTWLTPETADLAAGDLWARVIENLLRFLGLLIERGVPVRAGTDVPWTYELPGHLLWRELAFLTQAGLTPIDALRAATSHAARVLHAEGLGRLAPGCAADFVIVEGDPTQAIPARPVIAGVVQQGRFHRQHELLAQAKGAMRSVTREPMGRAFTRYYNNKAG